MAHGRTSRKSRLALAVAVAAFAGSLSAGAAFAGEINGTGSKFQYSQGRSVCKFSGLNDKPDSTNPMDPGGRVQSYGYSVVRNGLKAFAPSPGVACNPNNEFEG
jgi:hypothetical protein